MSVSENREQMVSLLIELLYKTILYNSEWQQPLKIKHAGKETHFAFLRLQSFMKCVHISVHQQYKGN